MQREVLDYETAKLREEKLPVGIVAVAIVPFLMVSIYIFGTVLLQDYLVNGDGRSWQRAAMRMAIPTGLITAAALAVGIVALFRSERRRVAAVVATVASALALVFIICGTT